MNESIRKKSFSPDFLGIFINPIYLARKELYLSIKSVAHYATNRILDVGCGSKPYKDLFTFKKYIGIDIKNPAHSHEQEDVDFYYDGKSFPFSDSSFDSLVCFEVLEHVFNPDSFLEEIVRVVKPRGYIIMTMPFIYEEHEKPNDYCRYSSFGFRHIAEKNDLVLIEEKKLLNDLRIIFLLLNTYIYRVIFSGRKKKRKINLILALLSCSLSNIVGIILSKILPRNDDIYFGNIFVLRNNKEK